MPRIFISYRRSDSQASAGRVYDHLVDAYGRQNVFKDVEDIPPGATFADFLAEQLSRCQVALVVIGQHWLTVTDQQNRRRLDDPEDWVRIEVSTALRRKDLIVIPLLVDGASLPVRDSLPRDLQPLCDRQAAHVRPDPDFQRDMRRLISQIERPIRWRWIIAGIASAVVLIALAAVFLWNRAQLEAVADQLATSHAIQAQMDAIQTRLSESSIQEDAQKTLVARGELPSDTPTATPTSPPSATPSFTPTELPTVTVDSAATATAGAIENARQTQIAEAVVATLHALETLAVQPTVNAATNTPQPTATFPINLITANSQWTPVIQTFDGVEMVFVPTGCFMMGSEDGDADERPVHQQCFDTPFWIDRLEVTNSQFTKLGGKAAQPGDWGSQPDFPRHAITWFEARDFCEINRSARLPTEAEWEYAARGPDSLIYPWGNNFVPENVVYVGTSGGSLARAGSRPGGASWVGALDMSGNVWEWTSSINDPTRFPYPYDPNDGREDGLDRTSLRTIRGGTFVRPAEDMRSAARFRNTPAVWDNGFGFRCARSY